MVKLKFRTALGIPYIFGILVMLSLVIVFWNSNQNNVEEMQTRKVLRIFAKTMVNKLDSSFLPSLDFAKKINKRISSQSKDAVYYSSIEDVIRSGAPSIFKAVPEVELLGYQDNTGRFFLLKNPSEQYLPYLLFRNSKSQKYIEQRAGTYKDAPLVTKFQAKGFHLINQFNKKNKYSDFDVVRINGESHFDGISLNFPWKSNLQDIYGENFIAINFSRLKKSLSQNLYKDIKFSILDNKNEVLISSLSATDANNSHVFKYEKAIREAIFLDKNYSKEGKFFKKLEIKNDINKTLEKFQTLSFSYRLENKNWLIILALPMDSFVQSGEGRKNFISILLLISMATILFGMALIHKLLSPLMDIVNVTRLLSQGELDKEINLKSSYILETNHLVENVNHMSRQITASFEAIRYSLHHDSLTGLLNLKGFKEAFNTTSSEFEDGILNLALISVKNFRVVNGSFGRSIGDIIIQSLASRMRQLVPYDSLLVRIEGVDFAILVKTANKETFLDLIERLHKFISEPYKIENEEIMIKSRIGYVQEHNLSYYGGLDRAIRKASIALGNAKNFDIGINEFNENMMLSIVEQSNMENELYKASNNNIGLMALYQPVVDLQDNNKLHGAEALLRWNSEKRGLVYPNTFISIAEKSNLILNLDKWILNNVCERLSYLNKDAVKNKFNIHVNLSTRQILQTDLAKNVQKVLERYGTDPSMLTIEITESVMIDMNENISENLKEIRNTGIKLALDDFGTGYSSLSYLHQLEFDSFKIDKTFINNVLESKKNQSIVRAILAMADGIGAEVIAEGVETAEQAQWLKEEGCGYAQGYYYAKPIEFDSLLKF